MPWLTVGSLVALATGAVLLSVATSPPAPGSKAAMTAMIVSAENLGAGWSKSGTVPYRSDALLFPCVRCRERGPQWRANVIGALYLRSPTGNFQETFAWMNDPSPIFDGATRTLRKRLAAVPGIVMLGEPPRIGTDDEVGVAWLAAGSHNLQYWVETGEYLGEFYYSGPGPGISEMDAAIARFG